MKGAGAFLVVFVGLLLLWVVLAGKAGNLSAAANVLTGATTSTSTGPAGVTLPATGVTLPNPSGTIPTTATSPVAYNEASYVSPTGLTYG